MALCLVHSCQCDTLGPFLEDLMKSFHLKAATIVSGGDWLPDLCMTNEWVLCLQHYNHEDAAPLAERVELLHRQRKQDAVIFTGALAGLIEILSQSAPTLFRS